MKGCTFSLRLIFELVGVLGLQLHVYTQNHGTPARPEFILVNKLCFYTMV